MELFFNAVLIIFGFALAFLIGLRECDKEWKKQGRKNYKKMWF